MKRIIIILMAFAFIKAEGQTKKQIDAAITAAAIFYSDEYFNGTFEQQFANTILWNAGLSFSNLFDKALENAPPDYHLQDADIEFLIGASFTKVAAKYYGIYGYYLARDSVFFMNRDGLSRKFPLYCHDYSRFKFSKE